MRCPHCNSTKLFLGQDCIAYTRVYNGKISPNEGISYLDNSWLECHGCSETSDDSEELNTLYKELVNS
jgi:hypothetical protein